MQESRLLEALDTHDARRESDHLAVVGLHNTAGCLESHGGGVDKAKCDGTDVVLALEACPNIVLEADVVSNMVLSNSRRLKVAPRRVVVVP